MNLPFLKYLKPLFGSKDCFEPEPLRLHGHILVEHQVGDGPKRVVVDDRNYIVAAGVTAARDILMGPNGALEGGIFRMAIGDNGTEPGQLYTPKIPDASWDARTSLYHEVYRNDIAAFSTPTYNSMRFVGTFNSTGIADASYDLSAQVINEAALIAGDGALTAGGDPKQHGTGVDADEVMFSTRTFNSVPWGNGDDITITITWTISVIK